MRPIETQYRGVTFRSRLEARWAYFFDRLEIGWEYEPYTFDEGNLGLYTPDFRLPAFDWWAEVKPVWPTKLEVDKCRAVPQPVVLLIGAPDFHYYWAINGGNEIDVAFLLREIRTNAAQQFNRLEDFPMSYHAAVESALKARFDGYDGDRGTIRERYA